MFVLDLAFTIRISSENYFSPNSSVMSFMGGRIRFCDAVNARASCRSAFEQCPRSYVRLTNSRAVTCGSPSHYFGAGCRSERYGTGTYSTEGCRRMGCG
jgi:hypothetical protein